QFPDPGLQSLLVRRFPLPFLQPPRTPLLSRLKPPLFHGSLRTQLRDLDGSTLFVHRDKGEITGVGVTPPSGHELFSLDANADFHRCASGEIDARLQDDEVAKMYRLAKVDAIDRGRHDR